MSEHWLNTRQAAEYLNVGVDTMRSMMPEIPGARRTRGERGDWRVKADMIDEWMAAQRKETP